MEDMSDWRDANIVPIFTPKGNKQQAGNYRPVSLIRITCKLIENVSTLMKWTSLRRTTCNKQPRLRKKCLCESQLVTTIKNKCSKLCSGKNQVNVFQRI